MPGMAFIYHPQGSRNAYHGAMLAVSGFGVKYNQNTNFSNPILTAQPPNGFGFGGIKSNYALLEVPLGVSRALTDKLSVGVSVVPAFSMLQVVPAPFSAPVMAGSTSPYYMSAGYNAPAFGGGFNGGMHYRISDVVSIGLAYHSHIWFLTVHVEPQRPYRCQPHAEVPDESAPASEYGRRDFAIEEDPYRCGCALVQLRQYCWLLQVWVQPGRLRGRVRLEQYLGCWRWRTAAGRHEFEVDRRIQLLAKPNPREIYILQFTRARNCAAPHIGRIG